MEIMSSDRRYPVWSMATLLHGLSIVYKGVLKLRRKLYGKQLLPSYALSCPVISVGNLSLGGTGKTPMVIHLAKLIQKMGYRAAIISRGYKGTAQDKGAIVSDGNVQLCSARQSGDEPFLISMLVRNIPVLVGADRYAAAKRAVDEFKPDLIVLDDAFQHLRLKRDFDLVLLDARRPFGNSHVLPRGRLRESTDALAGADAIVFTRSNADNATTGRIDIRQTYKNIPVFRSAHRSVIRGMAPARQALPSLSKLQPVDKDLKGRKLCGFAGLADNDAFFDTIADCGGNLVGTLAFEDHFAYEKMDIQKITRFLLSSGADALITTDKDFVRLSGKTMFPKELLVMGVDLHFADDEDRWKTFLIDRITRLVEQRQVD